MSPLTLARFAALIAITLSALLIGSQRAFAVAYTWSGTAAINSAANWAPGGGPPTTADSGTISSGTATVTPATVLTGTPTLAIGGTGILSMTALTAAPVTGGVITVNSGGRLEYSGASLVTAANTVTMNNGSAWSSNPVSLNVADTTFDNFTLGAGATVTAMRLQGTGGDTAFALTLAGAIIGDGTTTIAVNPTVAGNTFAPLRIAPSSANTSFTGAVSVSSSVVNNRAMLVLGGTGALQTVGSLTISGTGGLRFDNVINPLPSASVVNIPNGARMEWMGTQTYNSGFTAPTIALADGAHISNDGLNVADTSPEAISIASGATVTASRMSGTSSDTAFALSLQGQITGDNSTTLVVNPTAAGNTHAPLRINSTTGNAGFTGTVTLSSSIANTFGTLVLSGTNALSGITALNVNSGGQLRLSGATNPLPSAMAVNISTGGRMEWEGVQSYSVTPPSFTFANNSSFGRNALNAANTVSEAITIAPAANVTVRNITGTSHNTGFAMTLTGPLSGSADSIITIIPGPSGNRFGGLAINRASANPYLGSIVVSGDSVSARGTLMLSGTSPLGNAALVDIQNFGTVAVLANGGLNNIDEVRTQSGGILRFHNAAGSIVTGTTLTGTGIVRSELGSADLLTNTALRSLTLNGGSISPGLSPGTLTFDVTTLTLSGTSLEVEAGIAADLIDVNGTLSLDPNTTLIVNAGAGLDTGDYVVATYDNLIGTFGTIVSNLPIPFVVTGIDYGILNPNAITISIVNVPEPSTLAILGIGAVGILVQGRRRRGARG